MTPEQLTAFIAALLGAGGCCAAILTPLGVVLGIVGDRWLTARKASADIRQSEVNMLRTNIEEIHKRYKEDVETIRQQCAEDRLADKMEAKTCRDELDKSERRVRELVEDLNGERKENYRIRALAYQAGFEIPDERRQSDFTAPLAETKKE